MNTLKTCLSATLLALLLFLPSISMSQTSSYQATPVAISHVVDTVLGKVYFVHQVQKGHTLYSISRAYRAQADQMLKDSPESQVQAGEYIYIPFQSSLLEQGARMELFKGKKPWAVVFLERDHERAETAAGNRQVPSPALSLPQEGAFQDGAREEESDKEKRKRQRREARLERQSAKADSAGANEFIPKEGSAPGLQDSVPPCALAGKGLEPEKKAWKDTLDIALMLPLYSSNPDDRRAYIYLPFFEGASIAWIERIEPGFFAPAADSLSGSLADSLAEPLSEPLSEPRQKFPAQTPAWRARNAGLPAMNFRLYDLTESAQSLEKALQDPSLAQSEALMAASFVNQFPLLDSFSSTHRIPFVHPLSERDSMGAGNPYFVQLCANHQQQLEKITSYVELYHPYSEIIILTDSTPAEQSKAARLQKMLPSARLYIFNPETSSLLDSLPSDHGITIIPFYQQEITAVKTLLPLRQSKGNITLLAPASWLDYTTIELDYFLQNNLTVYATFRHSENDSAFKTFAKHYYFIYRGIPNTLAYQGYRAFDWLLGMLSEYNADFLRHLSPQKGSFPFHPVPREGMAGFGNPTVYFLRLTESGLEDLPPFD